MAHIPYSCGLDLATKVSHSQFIAKLTNKLQAWFSFFGHEEWAKFSHYHAIDQEELEQVRRSLIGNGIPRTHIHIEPFCATIRGSGTFSITRIGDA